MKQAGSVSTVILIIIIFISILFIGASFLMQAVIRSFSLTIENQDIKKKFTDEAQRIAELLLENMDPDKDSRFDKIWDYINTSLIEGAEITLSDVSSFLNPNWIRKGLLEDGVLTDLLKPEKTSQELQDFREQEGLQVRLNPHYLDFFDADILEQYFSPYSFFNINITDEFVLRDIYVIRTGKEEEADVFHAKIQDLLKKKKVVEKDKLQSFLAEDYADLYPVINTEPVFNINFLDEKIVKAVIAYKAFEVKEPQKYISALITARDSMALTQKDIKAIIGDKYEKTRIKFYLGSITWFWRLEIKTEDCSLIWILARIPAQTADEDTKTSLKLIEEVFTR